MAKSGKLCEYCGGDPDCCGCDDGLICPDCGAITIVAAEGEILCARCTGLSSDWEVGDWDEEDDEHCPDCGQHLGPNGLYCFACGADLSGDFDDEDDGSGDSDDNEDIP